MTITRTHEAQRALKRGDNGEGTGVQVVYDEDGETHFPSNGLPLSDADVAPISPPKAPSRLLRWVLLSLVAVVAVAAGVAYYLYSLGYESTDDAFIDAHKVPISSRVSGHVTEVCVNDNQLVKEGDLIARIDPADFETRVAAAAAALKSAKAGTNSRTIGVDVTEITSNAGVNQAVAAVDGAKAGIETALAAVATAKNQQAAALAQLAATRAGSEQAQAEVTAADARRQRAQAHLHRIEQLVPEHAASQDNLEEAMANDRVAKAEVAASQQRVSAAEAAINQAQAAVAAADSGLRQAESGVESRKAALGQAEAQLAAAHAAPQQVAQGRSQAQGAESDAARAQAELSQAKLNLSYTEIRAPISGHVTGKSVEPGAYIQVGQPLLAVVDPNVWVVANFKETQLAHMRPGQPVSVAVDAYPGVRFSAHLDSIQRGSGAAFSLLPPENASGNYVKVVQRVPVKIVFDDPAQLEKYALGPGMSVVPTVKIATGKEP